MLHFDSHTDTYPIPGYNTATTFTRAAEEGLLDVARSFHVGTRGSSFMPGVLEFGREVGYTIVPFDDFDADRTGALDAIRQRIGQRPVYLCFDMDIFDPSCAPGVCTPEWGGLSPKEGLALLRQLAGLNFVAFDVNTVSPPQDVQGATAFWPRPSCRNSARWRRPRCSGIRKGVRPDPARWRHSYIPGEIHDTQIHSARPGVGRAAGASRRGPCAHAGRSARRQDVECGHDGLRAAARFQEPAIQSPGGHHGGCGGGRRPAPGRGRQAVGRAILGPDPDPDLGPRRRHVRALVHHRGTRARHRFLGACL